MMRASSSTILFVTLFVSYAAGSGLTRKSKGIVGRSIHYVIECELLISVMVTLADACTRVGCCGWRGGYTCCVCGG